MPRAQPPPRWVDGPRRVTWRCQAGGRVRVRYDGRTGAQPGLVLGHEPLGVIEEVGAEISLLRPGQRVVVPTHLFCGLCFNCARGDSAASCGSSPAASAPPTAMPAWAPTGAPRPSGCGCPSPTPTACACPGEPGDELEDDLVLLADAFVTGWHATELAEVTPADSVAVFGASTIGLLAADRVVKAVLRPA